jgi:hypothetical protein
MTNDFFAVAWLWAAIFSHGGSHRAALVYRFPVEIDGAWSGSYGAGISLEGVAARAGAGDPSTNSSRGYAVTS